MTIKKLHHLAMRCSDAERTRQFYEDFLGLPLVHTLVIDETKTGRTTKTLHIFFQLDDGSHLAFFEAPDLPFEFGKRTIDRKKIDHQKGGFTIRLTLDYGKVKIVSNGVDHNGEDTKKLNELQDYLFPIDGVAALDLAIKELGNINYSNLTSSKIEAIRAIANCGAERFSPSQKKDIIINTRLILFKYMLKNCKLSCFVYSVLFKQCKEGMPPTYDD